MILWTKRMAMLFGTFIIAIQIHAASAREDLPSDLSILGNRLPSIIEAEMETMLRARVAALEIIFREAEIEAETAEKQAEEAELRAKIAKQKAKAYRDAEAHRKASESPLHGHLSRLPARATAAAGAGVVSTNGEA